MAKSTSIKNSLLFNFLLIIVMLSSAITAITFFGNRHAIKRLSEALISTGIDHTESKLRSFFQPVIRELYLVRAWDSKGIIHPDKSPEYLRHLLSPLLSEYRQVSSVLLADSHGHEFMLLRKNSGWMNRITKKDQWKDKVLWYEWSPGSRPVSRWQRSDYDPRLRPWYKGALSRYRAGSSPGIAGRQSIFWTKPYIFHTTREPGLTASIAYDMGDGVKRVVGVDILLSDITRFTAALKLGTNGKVAVMTDDLKMIGLPRTGRRKGNRPHSELLKTPAQLEDPLIHDAFVAFTKARSKKPGYTGPFRFKSKAKVWIGEFRHFRLSPQHSLWIAAMAPEDDYIGGLWRLRIWIIVVTVLVMAIAIFRAFMLAKGYSRPIGVLVKQSERISRGMLYEGEKINSSITEVERLAEAHEKMRIALTSLLRLERDVQLARQIQQNTLPTDLPNLRGFELGAWSQPADETGGDTYDVIGYRRCPQEGRVLITDQDPDCAVLLMADATGHGIGPALSASEVRAMLRMAVRNGEDLATIARHINEQLCQDLHAGRFITCWLGVLDSKDCSLTSFSAGQAPILYYSAADGQCRVMAADTYPLGIDKSLPVQIAPPLKMAPGDLCVVISDGILEAVNAEGEQFGQQRVIDILVRHNTHSCTQILFELRQTLSDFTGDISATDDRTLVLIKRIQGGA